MASSIRRAHLQGRIRCALAEAEAVAKVDHKGLRGTAREIFCRQLLSPVLPTNLHIGTGVVEDSKGLQSRQIDQVVYEPGRLPPLLWDQFTGTFPIESVACAIEIKSVLNATELEAAIQNAKSLSSLSFSTPPIVRLSQFGTVNPALGISGMEPREALVPSPARVIHALFAYQSDLSPDGKTELCRYFQAEAEMVRRPSLPLICVAGRGFWMFDTTYGKWREHSATEEFDEVIEFLSVISNSAQAVLDTRLLPTIGSYLISTRDYYHVDPANSSGKRAVTTTIQHP